MNEKAISAAVERGNTAYWDDAGKQTEAAARGESVMKGNIIEYVTRAIVEAAKEYGWCPACKSDCFVLGKSCRGCGGEAEPPRLRVS